MPNTHIGTIPPDKLQFRRELVRHWRCVAQKIWARVGDGKVGIVLLDRFWSGSDPWVSADYVTVTLENTISDDTVRRRLKDLVKTGVVLERKEGRLTLFAFRPSIAEELTSMMEAFSTAKCEQIPTDSRNLRDNLVVVGPYNDS